MNVSKTQIAKDCSKIKKLWSEGVDDADIRLKLSLSDSEWERRLRSIAEEEYIKDRPLILKKYELKKMQRYRALQLLHDSTRSDSVKLGCIQEMGRIDDSFIKTGQSLGIFHKEPELYTPGFQKVPKDFLEVVVKLAKKLIQDKFLPFAEEEPKKDFIDVEFKEVRRKKVGAKSDIR